MKRRNKIIKKRTKKSDLVECKNDSNIKKEEDILECQKKDNSESVDLKRYDENLDYVLNSAENLMINKIRHFFGEDDINIYIDEIFRESIEKDDSKNNNCLIKQ